jgi:hypothetical protein
MLWSLMNESPLDPHDIPLEKLFPKLKPEQREPMRDFLDGYLEVALQVWERIERDAKKRDTNA